MQPVQHFLFLRNARKDGLVLLAQLVVSMSEPVSLLLTLGVVRLHPTRTNHQDISDLDIATLRSWADVNTLALAGGSKFIPRNRVVRVAIVLFTIGLCITPVIDQDSSPGDAVLGPVVDGTLMAVLVLDLSAGGSVVEFAAVDVREVAEAIKLRPALGVHVVLVVIRDVGRE